jgi:hypothetical protein
MWLRDGGAGALIIYSVALLKRLLGGIVGCRRRARSDVLPWVHMHRKSVR